MVQNDINPLINEPQSLDKAHIDIITKMLRDMSSRIDC